MKLYFPQWQGAGTGKGILSGAEALLQYLGPSIFEHIELSKVPAGTHGEKRHCINNYGALHEQLLRLKTKISEERPTKLHTIGGDCGLEIVPVSYLNQRYPKLGVVWFDAHADINRPCDSTSCNFHGMPLRTLLGEGEPDMDSLLFSTLTPRQIHYVGLRDVDPAEKQRIAEGQIYAPTKPDAEALVQTMRGKNIAEVYIHFDFDCLDPLDYDKTYYQVPKGLRIGEAEACIKALQNNFKIVGTSVLESVTPHVEELEPIHNLLKLLME